MSVQRREIHAGLKKNRFQAFHKIQLFLPGKFGSSWLCRTSEDVKNAESSHEYSHKQEIYTYNIYEPEYINIYK